MDNQIIAKVVRGYGVASGKNFDSRFPDGTIAMQIPFFAEQGLDLNSFYKGTINLDLYPGSFKLVEPKFQFADLKWSDQLAPENFSFYPCKLSSIGQGLQHDCLVYWPHPSTKPEFHQSERVLEIMGPWIPSISYGSEILISAEPNCILFCNEQDSF